MRPFVVIPREQVSELLEILELYYGQNIDTYDLDGWLEYYQIAQDEFERNLNAYIERFDRFLKETDDPYYIFSDAEDVEYLCGLLEIIGDAINEFCESDPNMGYYSHRITHLVYELDYTLYKALHENETVNGSEEIL